jgi:hypothetical protein
MCTVTYLPVNKESFILTSNRDEKTVRPAAELPDIINMYHQEILFPKDPKANGTWIASTCHRTVCLLNGALFKHESTPPYKKSRGLVVLESFQYKTVKEFINSYNFIGIEPFTLILWEYNNLYELRWDGSTMFYKELNAAKPYICASVTLYTEEIIKKRKDWFQTWLTSHPYKTSDIRDFHRFAGEGDIENDILINRNDSMVTVSITTVQRNNTDIEMIYEDLRYNKFSIKSLCPVS